MLTHTQKVRKLYKAVLKLNNGLPMELKLLGNNYVRSEFKRHKKCNSAEADVFMREWCNYAVTLSEQLGLRGPKTGKPLGSELKETDLENFRDEQLHQLFELKTAASVGKRNDQKKNEF
ncbi:hypothetical protein RN001_002136 [Aquatica leii]|uniref:Succinate dehydrogenase assembly factor 3 n=1 Tax=Aquatica leii TaxID=1421715 RepID=A0AAN7PCZ2_9COLE|nr:hypothetical protein RN001_002136 [Aquatica leii]